MVLDAKKFRGEITSPANIRREAGLYWGYKVMRGLSFFIYVYKALFRFELPKVCLKLSPPINTIQLLELPR